MDRARLEGLQRLALGQLGLFTSRQAEQVGISCAALQEALQCGWLRRVRRGVYAFSVPPCRWEPILAASLAAGPAAVISHGAAAAIHGFWGVATIAPELTLPLGGRQMAGVRIHRSVTLLPDDVVRRRGVLVTSPVRTLIDIAPFTNDYLLPRIVDEGTLARLWTPEAIDSRLVSLAGRRRAGVADLRRLIGLRLGEGNPDGVLEQRIFRVLKGRVPPFVVHHRVKLGERIVELDIARPAYRIAGEVEGRRIRMTSRTKFDSDRLRSNLLLRHGWREVHFTAGMDRPTVLAQVLPLFSVQ